MRHRTFLVASFAALALAFSASGARAEGSAATPSSASSSSSSSSSSAASSAASGARAPASSAAAASSGARPVTFGEAMREASRLKQEGTTLLARGDGMHAGAAFVYASYAHAKAAAVAPTPGLASDAHRLAGNAELMATKAYRVGRDPYAAATSLRSAARHFQNAGLPRTAAATNMAATRQMNAAFASGRTAMPPGGPR